MLLYIVYCPSTTWVKTENIENGNGELIMTLLPHNHLPPNVDIPMVHLRRSVGLTGKSTGNLATSIRKNIQPKSCVASILN